MYIKVSVRTDAKREFVIDEGNDKYVVGVAVPAERGMANKRTLELLRSHFGSSRKIINIASGHHSPHKIVSVEDKE